jgi:hypothetical protein
VGIDKNGTLGTEISLYVNGILNAKMHTSCSKPIGPGLVQGDFLVIDGASRNGGLLCPAEDEPGGGGDGGGDDYDSCESGKPSVLTMAYTGLGCDASMHSQDPSKVTCDGDPAGEALVRIIATDKDDPNDNKARIFFDGEVALGGVFNVDAYATDLSRLRAETRVFVYDLNGNLLQFVKFHTSCSQPLNLGDQFGSLELVSFEAEAKNGALIGTPDAQVADEQVPEKAQQALSCAGGAAAPAGSGLLGDFAVVLFIIVLLAAHGKGQRSDCQ